MQNRLWLAGILAITPILALSPVAFPGSTSAGCARSIAGSRYNQRLFRSLMRRTDSIAEQTLEVYRVPRVRPQEILPVTDPVVCSRAAIAYNRAVGENSSDRKVHILRVGNRYVVMDPAFKASGHRRAVTFDSTLTQPLAHIAE
ncbi:MAG: hypothetical protein ABIS03_03115 [Gemmatimonadaceae bacterium]